MADMPPPEWGLFGMKASHIVAGVLGGLIRWIVAPQKSLIRNIGASLVSLITCIYGTPVASPVVTYYFSALFPDQSALDGAVGFVLGVTGYSIISGLIKMAARWGNDPIIPYSHRE